MVIRRATERDARTRIIQEFTQETLDERALVAVVVVEQTDKLAAALRDRCAEASARAQSRHRTHVSYAGIRERRRHVFEVARIVVDHQFEFVVGLLQHARDGLVQPASPKGTDGNGDEWRHRITRSRIVARGARVRRARRRAWQARRPATRQVA